ncbi:MAG: hypothetical protein K2Q28_02490 [Hyphomicrobium sp.]|nr:hypothetical protein [Hyphomicrobium sp.]
MKGLKGLTFRTINKGRENPTLVRRAKLARRLEQQKALALDPTYTLTVTKWVKGEGGGKELRQVSKRLSPWWREDVLGNIALTVRAGGRPIEFEKGKTAIVVPGMDQLVPTIDTVLAAVRAGELDELLTQQIKAREVPKAKRAA